MTSTNKKATIQPRRIEPHQKGLMLFAILAIIASVYVMHSAYAVTQQTNDSFFSCGKKYNGDKSYNNTYTGTKSLYGRNTSCVAVNPGLIDGRTNYVLHTTASATNSKVGWQASIQGTDPWGTSDTGGGALNHNSNFPVAANKNFVLQTQYVWITDATSVPSALATNGAVTANLLTDLWFKDTTAGSDNVLVIDFASENVKNQNGAWVNRAETIGTGYSSPHYEKVGTQCRYHYSMVLDNGQAANQWRQTISRNISGDISSAFSATYTNTGTGGTCPSSPAHGITAYNTVDIETGVEVFIGTIQVQNYGTMKGAFSLVNLTY